MDIINIPEKGVGGGIMELLILNLNHPAEVYIYISRVDIDMDINTDLSDYKEMR